MNKRSLHPQASYLHILHFYMALLYHRPLAHLTHQYILCIGPRPSWPGPTWPKAELTRIQIIRYFSKIRGILDTEKENVFWSDDGTPNQTEFSCHYLYFIISINLFSETMTSLIPTLTNMQKNCDHDADISRKKKIPHL